MMLVRVAAVARNGVIGQRGAPSLAAQIEVAHFRRCTIGKPVVMGRKTYVSIGKPLVGPDKHRDEPRSELYRSWYHRGGER